MQYLYTKICNKCKIPQENNYFSNNKNSPDGKEPRCKLCTKQYKNSIKEQQKLYFKKYNIINRKRKTIYSNIYKSNKRKNNIQFRISDNLRSRFFKAINSNSKSKSIITLLGCSVIEFKLYLEQQFINKMDWNNYGKIWEIDHIKPCSKFDLTKLEEQQKCFHYTNLMPRFKTTEIAEQYGSNQIGNRNKSNQLK